MTVTPTTSHDSHITTVASHDSHTTRHHSHRQYHHTTITSHDSHITAAHHTTVIARTHTLTHAHASADALALRWPTFQHSYGVVPPAAATPPPFPALLSELLYSSALAIMYIYLLVNPNSRSFIRGSHVAFGVRLFFYISSLAFLSLRLAPLPLMPSPIFRVCGATYRVKALALSAWLIQLTSLRTVCSKAAIYVLETVQR